MKACKPTRRSSQAGGQEQDRVRLASPVSPAAAVVARTHRKLNVMDRHAWAAVSGGRPFSKTCVKETWLDLREPNKRGLAIENRFRQEGLPKSQARRNASAMKVTAARRHRDGSRRDESASRGSRDGKKIRSCSGPITTGVIFIWLSLKRGSAHRPARAGYRPLRPHAQPDYTSANAKAMADVNAGPDFQALAAELSQPRTISP